MLRRFLPSRSRISSPSKATEMMPLFPRPPRRPRRSPRDAERGAVAGAELLGQLGVARERQEAGGGGDPVVLDDHRAVVKRRVRGEDVDEQVVRDRGVELDPVLDVVAEPLQPLDDDQRADTLGRQGRGGEDDVAERRDHLLLLGQPPERVAPEVGERPADLLLEEHDDREREHDQEVFEDVLERRQLRELGHEVDQADEYDAAEHLHRPRAPDQEQQVVDHHGYEEDVEAVAPVEEIDEALDGHEARASQTSRS